MANGDEAGISVGGAADRQGAAQSVIQSLEGVAAAAERAPATLRAEHAQANALRRAQVARQQAASTPGMAATGGGFSGMSSSALQMQREQAAAGAQQASELAGADIAAAQALADIETQRADIAFANQQTRTTHTQSISTEMANMFANRQAPEAIGSYVGAQIGGNFNMNDPADLRAAAGLAASFLADAGVQGATTPELEKFLQHYGPDHLARLVSHKNAIYKYFKKNQAGALELDMRMALPAGAPLTGVA